MAAIEKVGGKLGFIDRLIYSRIAIPQTKKELLIRAAKLTFLDRQPPWGPGRVDTFNPYKALQFNYPMDKLPEEEIVGTVDLPSIWLQRPREGMQLHWDGDNSSVEERNKSAALGAGVTPLIIDLLRIKRIEHCLQDATSPTYPFPIDQVLASQGEPVYCREIRRQVINTRESETGGEERIMMFSQCQYLTTLVQGWTGNDIPAPDLSSTRQPSKRFAPFPVSRYRFTGPWMPGAAQDNRPSRWPRLLIQLSESTHLRKCWHMRCLIPTSGTCNPQPKTFPLRAGSSV
jgi:hypothetical protein